MERYHHYKLEDFLQDDDFRLWVKSGADPAGTVWEQVLLTYPDKTEEFDLAVNFFRQLKKKPSALSDEQLLKDVRNIVSGTEKKVRRPAVIPAGFLRYAAVLLLIAGAALYFRTWSGSMETTSAVPGLESAVTVSNSEAAPRVIVLPDSSRVTLAGGSRISYPRAWARATARKVLLTGEAFFEVQKDTVKPFLVYSGNIVTRVMGTSFTVRSLEADVAVTVRTGKVSVYRRDNDKESVVLTPNQKAVYTASKKTITRTLAELPVLVNRGELPTNAAFDEESAATILQSLSRAYGIPIRFDEARLKNCFLTLPFQEETFYHKLDILCKTLKAGYRIENNEVVIDSNGCE